MKVRINFDKHHAEVYFLKKKKKKKKERRKRGVRKTFITDLYFYNAFSIQSK